MGGQSIVYVHNIDGPFLFTNKTENPFSLQDDEKIDNIKNPKES